jgi:hypothetical protein
LKLTNLNIAFIFILFLLSVSCNSDDQVNKEQIIQSVPFVVGNSNSYRWSSTYDSSGIITSFLSDSFTVKVTSNSESVKGFNNLSLIEASKLNSSTVLQKVWYKSNNDSVTEIAYQFISGSFLPGISVFPKQQSYPIAGSILSLPWSVRMLLERKLSSDTLTMRDDPRIVYKFPLSAGKKWTSFRSPFLQTREVVGSEMVNARAGNFLCIKIKSTIGVSSTEPLEFYDYVCTEGLILRTFRTRYEVTTETNPGGTGVFINVNERLELIARN